MRLVPCVQWMIETGEPWGVSSSALTSLSNWMA